MAELRFRDVSKRFPDGTEAVKSLDLAIPDGKLMVLVGPSGCGKTTALRMVAGLEEITGGRIRIGDRVINDVAPRDRDIAMVFQNYALYPHMTVYQNMALSLRVRKLPKEEIRRRVDEAARVDGLSYWQIYWRIILPLSTPALTVCAVFAFLWNWNDLLGPLIYLNADNQFTVAIGLANLAQRAGNAQWNLLMAANFLSIIPPILVYFFLQRKLIGGIASVGLKG